MIDLTIVDHGSIMLMRANTDAAREWIDNHIVLKLSLVMIRQVAHGTAESGMSGWSAAMMPSPVLPPLSGRPLTAATVST